ncbi:MAG TPA: N-acetyl-gamma-glutamyl-phosphate reductase [Chitinophagaceae bacterium]|nr:N-acetyl-gamma-glutamyl-phosphate reductase [Chitinophagaceae bacterium]
MKIKAGIIGGAGYTGGELIRLLVNHPGVEIAFIDSKSNAGKPVYAVHQDLVGETGLHFSGKKTEDNLPVADVIFLCTGHGEARRFLEANLQYIKTATKIIDLSNDFRLAAQAAISDRTFVYGLPELDRDAIKSAINVANPGCFATAIQLGLLPLAQAGILQQVYTTGITGSTGAGQSLSATSHFSWRANNIQAYKTLTHQHLGEIYQSLHLLQNSFSAKPAAGAGSGLNFVPWRGDFTRGIFVSSTLQCGLSKEALTALYKNYYADHVFTTVIDDALFLKQVVNTNKCLIQLEKEGDVLVVHSAIDNLLKGASGQAVQNMNLMFGLEETAGLKLKANYF